MFSGDMWIGWVAAQPREPAAYQAVTGKQIQAAFAKYWSKANSLVVVVKPAVTEPAPRQSGPDEGTEPGR